MKHQKFSRTELQELRILNFEEACEYLGYKKSYMYKLTHGNILPFSKPNGKTIFFEREKLDKWMLSNSFTSSAEKEAQAATYVTSQKH